MLEYTAKRVEHKKFISTWHLYQSFGWHDDYLQIFDDRTHIDATFIGSNARFPNFCRLHAKIAIFNWVLGFSGAVVE